ncbi:MAG: methylmalonyl-CoA epimerase [Acidobacteria bacterium]|nr:methylmalonyl-CoA epimerase [Acidobacteriota bacterium]
MERALGKTTSGVFVDEKTSGVFFEKSAKDSGNVAVGPGVALGQAKKTPDVFLGIDHVGIAVADVDASLKFFAGVLGLAADAPQDVQGQNTRVRFVDTGDAKLELVESLAPGSPIGNFIEKRGPGLHHVALRVADIHAAIATVTAAGVRMIDQQPRRGAHGSLIAFVHPGDTHGVLVELKQPRAKGEGR